MPAIHPGARGAVITGWGTALPPKTLTNDDLEDMGLDTSDEWIVERTGIRERRVGGTTAGLSAEAGRLALGMSGLDPASIDAIVLATTTPDRTVPATSATVAAELGLRCGAFDINAACSGFTYALVDGPRPDRHGRRAGPRHRHRHARPHHRLGGPQHRDPVRRRLRRRRARGRRRRAASCSAGTSTPTAAPSGSSTPRSAATSRWTARRSSGGPCGSWSTRPQKSMAHAGVTIDDIALVVPHQANTRIIEAACDRLGIPHGPGRRRARPHRQHVVGLDPAGPRRRHRERPGPRRRPRPARRLRRRHDRGQRRHPLGRHDDA